MKNAFKAGLSITLGLSIFTSGAGVALAQTSTTTATSTLTAQIQTLLQQIKTLQDQINALNNQKGALVSQLQGTLQLTRQLSLGMSGDDVKTLQEILATDSSIYPEGLTTGFFGALTKNAVKRFQGKFGIDVVGRVGSTTLSRLNQLLTTGAGNSGKVPPGLLIAPGILKKLGTSTAYGPLPGQVLPPGIANKLGYNTLPTTTPPAPDTKAPVISSLAATNVASSTASISWMTNEPAKSVLLYGTTSPVTTSNSTNLQDLSFVTNHNFNLSGLSATTTYYFMVTATDASGNLATSSQGMFTTLGL